MIRYHSKDTRHLTLVKTDDQEYSISSYTLRTNCLCTECSNQLKMIPLNITLIDIQEHDKKSLQLSFSDAHVSSPYSYDLLILLSQKPYVMIPKFEV